MQSIRPFIKVFALLLIVLVGARIEVHAEQLNSVKDCYENPKSCGEEELAPKQAETGKATSDAVDESSTVGLTFWDFFKMIFATLFVIALLYFLLKFINKKSHGYKDSQLIQNMGGTSLGANRSVQMIRVGERLLVLGVGENIQLLKEIEDEEEARQIIQDYNAKMEQLMSPSDIVTKVMKRTTSLHAQEKEKENASFPSILRKQLDHITKERKKLLNEMEKKGSEDR